MSTNNNEITCQHCNWKGEEDKVSLAVNLGGALLEVCPRCKHDLNEICYDDGECC